MKTFMLMCICISIVHYIWYAEIIDTMHCVTAHGYMEIIEHNERRFK